MAPSLQGESLRGLSGLIAQPGRSQIPCRSGFYKGCDPDPDPDRRSTWSCRRLTWTTLVLVAVQTLGFVLFTIGFFPVKLSLDGVSGFEHLPKPPDLPTFGKVHRYSKEEISNSMKTPVFSGDIDLLSRYQAALGVSPQYDRLVLMVIDALPAEFVLGPANFGVLNEKTRLKDEKDGKWRDSAMPYVRKLLQSGEVIGFHAKAVPPTVTLPRLKAIISGSIPGFLDVALNFRSTAMHGDNLVDQLVRHGCKAVMFGDETWLRLFPDHFVRHDAVHGFFIEDTVEVDLNVSRHVDDEVLATDWDMLILHYIGLDHIGHVGGRSSPLMHPKLQEMDAVIEKLHRTLVMNPLDDRRTLLLIVSDHGMTDSGNHGGASPQETDTLALFMGAGTQSFSRVQRPRCHPPPHHDVDQHNLDPVVPEQGSGSNSPSSVSPSESQSLKEEECAGTIELKSSSLEDGKMNSNETSTGCSATSAQDTPCMDEAVMQVDLAPTLAMLLGLPIPLNSVGKLLPCLFSRLTAGERLRAYEVNAVQLQRLFDSSPTSSSSSSSSSSLSSQLATGGPTTLAAMYQKAIDRHRAWQEGSLGSKKSEDVERLWKEAEEAYMEYLKSASEVLSRAGSEGSLLLVIAGIGLLSLSAIGLVMLFGKTCLPGVEHALPSCSQDVDIGSQHASDATTAVSALGSGAISTHTVRRFELRRKQDRRHWGETDPSDPARSDSEDHHDDESDGLHATLCQNGLESQKSSHAKMRKRRKHPLYQFRNGYQSSSVGKPSHQMLQKRKRGKGIETSSLMFMQQGWRVLFRICRKFSFFGSFLGGFEPSVFATLTVLHSLSFTSTSFIEEENHTWYFFVATLWFVYLRSTISCTTWGKDRGNDHRGDLRDPFVIISGVSADGSEGEEGSHGKSDDGLQFNLGDRITKLRGTGSASSASYRAKCQIEIQMGAQTTDDNALGMNQTVSDRSDRLPLSILLAAVMAGLVASRILRGWHRGGVNFANQPDIAKLLEKDIDAKQVCTMIRGVVIGVVTLIMCVAVFFRFPQQEEDKRHHPKQVSGSRRLIDRAWDRARTGVFVVGVAAAGGTIWVYHAMDKRLAVIGNGTSLGSGKGSPPLLVGPIEFNVEPGTVAGTTYALLAVLMGLAFFDASWSCRREGEREAHECSDYVRDAKGLTSTALGNTKSKNLMAFNLRNLQENNRYAAERLSVGCAAACGSCGGPREKTEIMLTSGDSGESFSEGKGNENYEMPTNSDHTSTRQTDAAVAVTVARASLRGLERIGWVCMGITCLIQLLLQTETNAGVVLLMLLQLLAYLQYVENDSCRRRREWEIVLALEWLGTAGFFSTGNTNTLATINMSGAFTGLSPQNYVGAAILMFITTYGAPLLSVGPTMIALSRLGRRDVPSLSSTGFSSPNNSKASTCSRYQAWSQLPQRLCNITAVACIVPLAFHAIALATFTLVLFIHRGHPFIWIVFCPKYLYLGASTICVYLRVLVFFLVSEFLKWTTNRAARSQGTC